MAPVTSDSSAHRPPGANGLTAPGWHEASVADVRSRLGAPGPLDVDESARRLKTVGPNRLPEANRSGPLARLGRQLKNLLLLILLAAAGITALLGHWVDTTVILAVVVIQTLVGFLQEGKAEEALASIRHMLAPNAVVLRQDGRHTIPAELLVPGDTVLLESGDRVPADLRLEKVHGLQLDEAILTGESMAVDKTVDAQPGSAALGDQRNMAFSGTMVTTGTAQGVVVRTGTETEIGRISGLLRRTDTLKTPLLAQMDRFARYLSIIIVVVGILIFVAGTWFSGLAADELFMAVVGLTVAAIPEGLPAILTITLAIGVRRMAMRSAVVRRMPVIETLGAVSVICSDKTGTLTRNEMTVTALVAGGERYRISGSGYLPDGSVSRERGDEGATEAALELALAGTLCNDAELKLGEDPVRVVGDPMEGALKVLALKADNTLADAHARWPRLDEIPFDAEYRFMATLNHDHHGHTMVYLKGAPERVMAMCATELAADGSPIPLDEVAWQQAVDAMAGEGLRVLAFARRPMPRGTTSLSIDDVGQELELLGIAGFMDPPRPEVIQAIAECRQAGIRVKMITGDHAGTAGAIAATLGLGAGQGARVLTGAELDQAGDEALAGLARDVDVFARTSPEHKLRLVRALQAQHEVVAMTGDGVNDAPALKRADVGVAMGVKGSEAAREASSVVLLDDNFTSIVAAVREGRTVYQNLRKAIAFMLPINGGESISLVAALLLGLTLPITALQILWVNMVGSVVLAMTLAFEPPEPGIMARPPRPRSESLLEGFVLWRVVLVSLLFLTGIFAAWAWGMARSGDTEFARTMAVNTLVAMEVFYLFAVRYLDSASMTLRGVLGTPIVLGALAAVVVLQALFTWLPLFNAIFGSAPVDLAGLTFSVAAGVTVLMLLELETWLRTRLIGSGSRLLH
ncbi:plasma-membrane calcium-translocating P-type ATPase [Marinobacter daqiaonensis]|uniref:Plasma-membrane calcium-translocating P-type ATPase n=1 Tax=Marinobacter daqiaonensis TaxID=650891 RepID=A0A1I6JR83_9GAMM|nr:HAD-IC family P-type ATPase [Marinobacter daqiaonensis]SFR81499.1 plasma-membrane calcium-translocating P-type ATPase [Marinobacter daqiaonensis]